MGKRNKTKQSDGSDLSKLSGNSDPQRTYEAYICHLYFHIRPIPECIFCYPPEYIEYPGPITWKDQPWSWIEKIRFYRQR